VIALLEHVRDFAPAIEALAKDQRLCGRLQAEVI
jgi:hypothetical protein